MKMTNRHTQGFTLLELIGALLLIGVITAVVVPTFINTQEKARADAAIKRAQVLDLAKNSFVQKEKTSGQLKWEVAETDEAKYELLRPYLSMPPRYLGNGSQNSEKYYTMPGYSYELNGLLEPTTVTQLKNDAVIYGEPEEEEETSGE